MIHLGFVWKLFFSYVKCYMTKWKILVRGRVRRSMQSFRIISIAQPHTDHVSAGHLMKWVEATPHLLSAGIELDSWRASQTGLEKSRKERWNTFPSLVLIPFYNKCSHAHTAHCSIWRCRCCFYEIHFCFWKEESIWLQSLFCVRFGGFGI